MPEAPHGATPGCLHVTVVWSPGPRQVHEVALVLAEGATVLQALNASGLAEKFPALDLQSAEVGIWARRCSAEQALREGDRVEVYGALLVDPKVARRTRFQKQGARSAGLFAKKRAGAKAGY